MMTFETAIVTCLDKYTEFAGRASRSEFWWFALFRGLAIAAAQAISKLALAYVPLTSDFLINTLVSLPGLIALGLLLPGLAVGARRLHDIGRTGWWQLLALLGPFVIILLIFWVLPSKEEENKYGPYTPPTEDDLM